MKIIVTGGSGFLGSHLCERLLDQGNEVICLDNLFTGSEKNITHLIDNPNFEFIRHDITLPLYVEVDQIYTLACPASPEQYQKNPTTDFHVLISKMAKITRKQAKTINLGLFYGMGKNKLARSLDLDNEESKELFDQYHRKVPFVRELSNGLQRFAERNKNIFTLEDRFCRFNKC